MGFPVNISKRPSHYFLNSSQTAPALSAAYFFPSSLCNPGATMLAFSPLCRMEQFRLCGSAVTCHIIIIDNTII